MESLGELVSISWECNSVTVAVLLFESGYDHTWAIYFEIIMASSPFTLFR